MYHTYNSSCMPWRYISLRLLPMFSPLFVITHIYLYPSGYH